MMLNYVTVFYLEWSWILQTDSDLDDYVREHLKQLQQEAVKNVKKNRQREFAKMIAEDINKKN